MTQLNNNYPPNHAPTYGNSPMHPLLAAINGNMDKYANVEGRADYHDHMISAMEPLEDDDTPMQRAYPNSAVGGTGWGGDPTATGGGGGGTGHSGYGYEQPSSGTGGSVGAYGGGGYGGGYDYHPAVPVHVPTGGSRAPYATMGSGYGAPVQPPKYYQPHPHPQPAYPNKGGDKKKKYNKKDSNASTMNALTLLAFFFFINLLQNCLKDNMEAMNPTVMVMTKNMVRNRNSKLAEMNSREHSTSPASTFTSGANIVVQPEDLVSAAAGAAGNSIAAAAPAGGGVILHTSPYSDGVGGTSLSNVGVSNAVHVVGGASITSGNSNNNQNHQNNNYDNNNQFARPPEPQFSYGSGGITTNQQHYSNVPNYGSQHNPNNNNNQAHAPNPHFGQVPFSATPTPPIIAPNHNPPANFHEPPFPYPNQTLISATSATLTHHQYYQAHQQQPHPYVPEHFDQEPHEPQIHRPLPKPQIHQPQQQQPYEINQFQQHTDYESQPHEHQSDHRVQYHDEHDQPPPQDHFQHHYPIEHHSLPEHHFPIERRPLRPPASQSESSNFWSYSPSSSSLNANKRGSHHSPLSSHTWSSGPLPLRVSGNNNFNDKDDEDYDSHDDMFFTRSHRRSYIEKL